MLLRPLLSAVAALALGSGAAAPALGQDSPVGDLGAAMRDPVTQQRMAGAVRAMSDALLNLRIAPLLKAIEVVEGRSTDALDPDLSLRDYAGPEAERVPRELSRRLPETMSAMGDVTAAVEAALPAFAAAAEGLRDRLDAEMKR
jgi:hypothetical protein